MDVNPAVSSLYYTLLVLDWVLFLCAGGVPRGRLLDFLSTLEQHPLLPIDLSFVKSTEPNGGEVYWEGGTLCHMGIAQCVVSALAFVPVPAIVAPYPSFELPQVLAQALRCVRAVWACWHFSLCTYALCGRPLCFIGLLHCFASEQLYFCRPFFYYEWQRSSTGYKQ